MFDFGFKKWLTPTSIKFIYAVVCFCVLMALAAGIIWFCMEQKYWQACLVFVFGTLAAMIFIFIVRIILECSLAAVRSMQSTTVLAHQVWSARAGAQPEAPKQENLNLRAPVAQFQGTPTAANNAVSAHNVPPAAPQQGAPTTYKSPNSYDNNGSTPDGMGPDGFYYHNGVAYRQVVVNTSKGPQQQWQPVGRR